jgi:hypothetical protein
MGKRVHVVKKQEEYGSTAAFNWKNEEFKSLLNALGGDVCESDDYGYSDRWEISVSDFEKAMHNLELYINGENLDDECVDMDDIESAIKGFEYDDAAEYVMDCMKGFYKERDMDSSWMIFVAW